MTEAHNLLGWWQHAGQSMTFSPISQAGGGALQGPGAPHRLLRH